LFEGVLGGVEGVAVEFGDELSLSPDEVDFVACDPLVCFRRGEAVALYEAQEVAFEV
jgi:hypothetical protein